MIAYPIRSLKLAFSGILLLASIPVGASAQQNQPSDPKFQVDARASTYLVRVVDKDQRVLRSLSERDFRILEDGRERPVISFQERESQTLSVGILLDIGSTMSNQSIRSAREAIHQLIHLLDREDEILLGVYDRDVDILTDLTSDRYQLVQGIENIGFGAQPGKWKRLGNLFMSDAYTGYSVDMSLLRMKKAKSENKAILVFSAGFGGIGEATFDHLRLAGARFFAVSYGNKLGDIFSLGGDRKARKRIVQDTGGAAFAAQGLLDRLESLRDSMKHYYLLAYSPAEGEKDLTERKVEISLRNRPGAVVHFVRRSGGGSSFY